MVIRNFNDALVEVRKLQTRIEQLEKQNSGIQFNPNIYYTRPQIDKLLKNLETQGAQTQIIISDNGQIVIEISLIAQQVTINGVLNLNYLTANRPLSLDGSKNVTDVLIDLADTTNKVQNTSGITAHTITLAPITLAGTPGSITWNSAGVITAFVDPT